MEAVFTGTARELVFKLAKVADEDERVFDLVIHREKRSLNQNAYYHVLLGQVADKLRISKSRLHNDMLRHFGQTMMIDGRPVCVMLPDTTEAEETAYESETVHLKPTSATVTGANGLTYRQWKMLRGSHDYDTREMAILLDGIIQEARQLDIEVMTPAQLEDMRRLEQQAEERKRHD